MTSVAAASDWVPEFPEQATEALSDPAATLVPEQEPAVSGGLRYRVDAKNYVTNSADDYSATTLMEMSAERGVVPAITVRGYPYGVLRIR